MRKEKSRKRENRKKEKGSEKMNRNIVRMLK